MNIPALCMMIAVISFLGFLVENLWISVTKGYMDNRNMIFPFLIGYGLAVVAINKIHIDSDQCRVFENYGDYPNVNHGG